MDRLQIVLKNPSVFLGKDSLLPLDISNEVDLFNKAIPPIISAEDAK
jgi:hypothetical protein